MALLVIFLMLVFLEFHQKTTTHISFFKCFWLHFCLNKFPLHCFLISKHSAVWQVRCQGEQASESFRWRYFILYSSEFIWHLGSSLPNPSTLRWRDVNFGVYFNGSLELGIRNGHGSILKRPGGPVWHINT